MAESVNIFGNFLDHISYNLDDFLLETSGHTAYQPLSVAARKNKVKIQRKSVIGCLLYVALTRMGSQTEDFILVSVGMICRHFCPTPALEAPTGHQLSWHSIRQGADCKLK